MLKEFPIAAGHALETDPETDAVSVMNDEQDLQIVDGCMSDNGSRRTSKRSTPTTLGIQISSTS